MSELNYGLLFRAALASRLASIDSLKTLNGIWAKYFSSSPGNKVFSILTAKPRVDSTVPCLGIEIVKRADPWGATSHTKDIRIDYNIYVAIKADVGQKSTAQGRMVPTEDLIIELAEAVYELLNTPWTLQYVISSDLTGNPLENPIKIYDSKADSIIYSHLYSGALRIAIIPWYGSSLRLGPSNPAAPGPSEETTLEPGGGVDSGGAPEDGGGV